MRSLTNREAQVLGLMAGGLSSKRIASRLRVREATVKAQRATLLHKLGAENAANAVHRGHQLGIIPGARRLARGRRV